MAKRFLITGCGRSGTLYTSQLLTAAGIPCGHESACRVSGFMGMGQLTGEVSWYAAAYLAALPKDVVVVHQLRNPLAVASSWYRIRLFAPTPLITVCYGRVTLPQLTRLASSPRATARRWRYIEKQRHIVRSATNVFARTGEAERCLAYWSEWNRLVETASVGRPFFRFRLEDLGPAVWKELGDFIDADLGALPDLARADGQEYYSPTDRGFEKRIKDPANLKPRYPVRPLPDLPIPDDVRSLAETYGYDVNRSPG